MTDPLQPEEITARVARIHDLDTASRATLAAVEQDAMLRAARDDLEAARIRYEKLAAPYKDRQAEIENQSAAIREEILTRWPHAAGKTIGHATLRTIRRVDTADPWKALEAAWARLGASSLPKIVKTPPKFDDAKIIDLLDVVPSLNEFFTIRETHSLAIKAPKEA